MNPAQTTPPTGQDPASGTGQDPTNPAPAQAAGTAMTLEQAQEALAAARREAAGYRTRAATLEKAQQDAAAAKLSDLERVQKERDTLAARLEAQQADARARI